VLGVNIIRDYGGGKEMSKDAKRGWQVLAFALIATIVTALIGLYAG
jgi:hypothetical protein